MTMTTQRPPLDDPSRQRRAARPVSELPPLRPGDVTVSGSEDDDFVDPDAVATLGEEHGLPPGRWIKVRRGLNWEQEQKLQLSLTGGSLPQDVFDAQGNVDPSKIKLDVSASNIAMVKMWVVDWNFQYKGEVMPIDDQHIRGLRPDRAAAVVAAIRKHVEGVDEGNAAPSESPSGG